MAIGSSYLTLADLFKRQGPEGTQAAQIIEILAQTNKILEDAPAIPCNRGATHLTTTRTGYPAPTWRRLYEGVQPTKSTTAQVEDATGMMEAWSEIDAKLVELAPNPAQFRLDEASAFMEGMNQAMATTLFYGNKSTNPERFHGLSARFDVYSATVDTPGNQIIKATAGGGGDNTSLWMIVWGPQTCHLIYPKGTMAGLKRQDLGEETKDAGSGAVYRVVRERFTWDVGLSVRDYRYIVRIANIDLSDLAAGSLDILDLLVQGYYKLKQREVMGGRAAIYCNANVVEAIDKAMLGKGWIPTSSAAGHLAANVRTTPGTVDGREPMSWRGMPIRQCDALLNTETAVS
jgi:hypothetical protein